MSEDWFDNPEAPTENKQRARFGRRRRGKGNMTAARNSAKRGGDESANHRGQLRMAYRLANEHDGELLHVTGIGWHVWDGSRFQRDDRGLTKRTVMVTLKKALADSQFDLELRQDVRRCESASGVNGVLDLAAALPQFAASVADLDADPYLLNAANGTLDLRTLEVRPHDPADRITKVCNASYDPGNLPADGVWAQFLNRVQPDEERRRFLQRFTGASLPGRVQEQVLGIFTGIGANGKSVHNGAILHALGDYSLTAEPDLFMHREGAHPTGEMDLRGVRYAVVSETEKDRRLAEAKVKRLTGGDTVRARRMRQDYVEFQPSHTAVLTTNHLPKVSGDDPAIWRRIRVVTFDVAIPEAEQDKTLPEKLENAADEVLAWAIRGYHEYVRLGGLAEPESVLVATNAYRKDSDIIGRFIEDCCITTAPTLKATTQDLMDAYDKWRITEPDADAMSLKAFGQALDRHGYPAGPVTNSKRWRNGIALPPRNSTEEAS